MVPDRPVEQDSTYLSVSPLMIFPQTRGEFRVFLKSEGKFVLYTREMELFSESHKKRLSEHGVKEVYIPAAQRQEYERYIERHMGSVLDNPDIPVEDRARVFTEASTGLVREIFDEKLPESMRLRKAQFKRINTLVAQSIDFLTDEAALKKVAGMIVHDYQLYTHSINVFVFTICVLNTYALDTDTMIQTGVGAILHDIGKTDLPKELLRCSEEGLEDKELQTYRSHPVRGVAMCSMVQLAHDTLNCILLHHERTDGSGYPSGITGESIPLPVKVMGLVNAYDALTSCKERGRTLTPYAALKKIRTEMMNGFDMDIYKRFVLVLSGANVI